MEQAYQERKKGKGGKQDKKQAKNQDDEEVVSP